MAPFLDPTDRGDDGDVGIIRSSVRAIVLPDRCRRLTRHSRTAEEGPKTVPPRGIKGEASKQCDLRDDRRQKSQYCLAFRRQVGVKPRGASTKGPHRLLATHTADARRFTRSSTRRTAVCGPARTVVREGRAGDCGLHPIPNLTVMSLLRVGPDPHPVERPVDEEH
jgi:hypothetical protein